MIQLIPKNKDSYIQIDLKTWKLNHNHSLKYHYKTWKIYRHELQESRKPLKCIWSRCIFGREKLYLIQWAEHCNSINTFVLFITLSTIETSFLAHRQWSVALSHNYLVLYLFVIYWKKYSFFSITFSHISWDLNWSGTSSNISTFALTALSHLSYTYSNS